MKKHLRYLSYVARHRRLCNIPARPAKGEGGGDA